LVIGAAAAYPKGLSDRGAAFFDFFRITTLERLLDRMTPLYKARTEEAAPQARAVLDAVALNWDPITANAAARESGLDVTAVNAQLARLENDGYVEEVEVSGSGRSGYQLVERFFNIWYLMRHGSRRLKQRVRWLTCFLRGFYSPGEREGLGREILVTRLVAARPLWPL